MKHALVAMAGPSNDIDFSTVGSEAVGVLALVVANGTD